MERVWGVRVTSDAPMDSLDLLCYIIMFELHKDIHLRLFRLKEYKESYQYVLGYKKPTNCHNVQRLAKLSPFWFTLE